jgi:hypothetical protein
VQVIGELAGQEDGAEAFWARVKTNLQAGRVRMVFVADRIPPELQRIVEFLNEQMDPAEVLAVELRQFLGGGVKTLAPRVLGQTAAAERQKGTGSPASVPFAERIQHAAPRSMRPPGSSTSGRPRRTSWRRICGAPAPTSLAGSICSP